MSQPNQNNISGIYSDGVALETATAKYIITEREKDIVIQVIRDLDEDDTPETIERIKNSPNKAQTISDDGKQLLSQMKFKKDSFKEYLATVNAFIYYLKKKSEEKSE